MRSTSSSSSASVSRGWAGSRKSERVDRHMKSASCSRSASSGFSAEEVAVVQACSRAWWAGSARACRALPSSARGEGQKVIRSCGSPVMSMVTLTRPWCGVGRGSCRPV
ncbi:hypothetical protein STANM309S_03468 [Streptomyces tanashiensis]